MHWLNCCIWPGNAKCTDRLEKRNNLKARMTSNLQERFMCVHEFLNLENDLGKEIKCQSVLIILSLSRNNKVNKLNIIAHKLEFIYHIKLKYFEIFCVEKSRLCLIYTTLLGCHYIRVLDTLYTVFFIYTEGL